MADEMTKLEEDEKVFAEEVKKRMQVIPQIIDPSVPIGKDDSENGEIERFGEPVVPDFEVPYHVDIMESFDGIDLDAARRTFGNGFYYLKGDIARLHSAILSYARDFMIDRGFTYYVPPFMIHGDVVKGVMSFKEMENMMYKIEGEDLYLIGTSEHSMIGKFIDTINDEETLRRLSPATLPCFRKGSGRAWHRGARRLPHPSVREAGNDRRLPARGQHGMVREAVAEHGRFLPFARYSGTHAGVLLRRPC